MTSLSFYRITYKEDTEAIVKVELDFLDKRTMQSRNRLKDFMTNQWLIGPSNNDLVLETHPQAVVTSEFDTILEVKVVKPWQGLCNLCNGEDLLASFDTTIDILNPTDGVDANMNINTKKLDAATNRNCKLSIVWNFSPVKQGPTIPRRFGIAPGTFYETVMPENVESMWGPVPLQPLKGGQANNCKVVTHK